MFESQMKKYLDKFMPLVIKMMQTELDTELWREGNVIYMRTTLHGETLYEGEVDITPE